MSRVALLDVNVLVALFYPDHVHHEIAHDWFSDHRAHGWATCALTENGLVRIVTNPASGIPDQRPAAVIARLRAFRASGHHQFWADAVSLSDEKVFNVSLIRGHRQVSDVYLLGLAAHHGGALATFDRTIPLSAVIDASDTHLQLITAVADE